MKKNLLEIKKLGNTKVKKSKPKAIDPTEYITFVLIACDQIIEEVDKFQNFCRQKNISQEVAKKLKSFAQTKSFINYTALTVFAITTDPNATVYVPESKNAQHYSHKFALTIIKHLAEELESESVESLCLRSDDEMRQFKEMNKNG